MQANKALRNKMRQLGVPFWRLGQVWGCHEVTAIRRFRNELPPDEQRKVLEMIRQAAAEMEDKE